MDWKKLLGSIAESVDEELRLRNEYLATENRLLRQQINGRVHLTDSDRKVLAEVGQQLGKKALQELATMAKPDTILAWHRTLVDQTGESSQPRQSVGRPRTEQEIEALVVRMAHENHSWGDDRIVGALAHLDYQISDQTVGNILRRHGIPPAPQRTNTTTWREFMRIHIDVLGATNFFTHEVWSGLALVMASMLAFIGICRRWEDVGGWVAHHHAQGIRSLLTWSLDGHADGQRGGHVMKMAAPSRPILCAESVQGYVLSACMPPDDRAPHPQDMDSIVGRPVGPPRPIRDGPMPCRHSLGRLLQDADCEAA
jgi:putative transposase